MRRTTAVYAGKHGALKSAWLMVLRGYEVRMHGDIFPGITSPIEIRQQAGLRMVCEAIYYKHQSIEVERIHVE